MTEEEVYEMVKKRKKVKSKAKQIEEMNEKLAKGRGT
jgi:hypothetical protein